jgi:hypothetical protein
MLDEFPSLGRLDILQESLAFLPGYGIKAYLIAQDINQLYAPYGRDEAITSTCHVQCAFAPNRIETAEHLSKLTGQTTVVKEQVTTSGRGWSTNMSRSTHEVSRPLLTPDEAMRMIQIEDDCGDLLDSPLPRNSSTTAATTGVTENWPTPRLPSIRWNSVPHNRQPLNGKSATTPLPPRGHSRAVIG